MSKHECPVIQIKLEPHPNADSLSLVQVFGYQCAVRTPDWKDGDLAVYIPPDSVVPDTELFHFLKQSKSNNWQRIRVKRLRGAISMGLLIKAPAGAKVGDNLMEFFGITHYEPPLPISTGGDNEKGPDGWFPTYDVENFRRWNTVIKPGEEVIVTEKIHGASARFCYSNDRIWVGSRTNWKKDDPKNIWWQTLTQNPWIETWCKNNPDFVLYGEVFGQVQNLRYGTKQNERRFAAFDIFHKDKWLSYNDVLLIINTPDFQWVPVLYRGPFDEKMAIDLAEGDSSIVGADHYREGVVVRPVVERNDLELGRVQLKIVSNRYLEKD